MISSMFSPLSVQSLNKNSAGQARKIPFSYVSFYFSLELLMEKCTN